MKEKGLTAHDVERNSNNEITNAYVVGIKNGNYTNPSPQKINALAKGLGVDPAFLFELASGSKPNKEKFEESIFGVIHHKWMQLSEESKAELRPIFKMIDRELEWRIKNQVSRSKNSEGKDLVKGFARQVVIAPRKKKTG